MKPTLTPYLNFDGNTAEAMKFYQSVLGGELSIQTFADAKMSRKPEDDKRTMHAALKNGAASLMASDGPSDKKVMFGNSVHLSLVGDDEKQLTEAFTKLSKGGTVVMPLAKQFWGDTFGMLTDKFGMHWMVNISAKK